MRVLRIVGFALLVGCTAAPVDGSTGIEFSPTSTGDSPQPTLVTSTTGVDEGSTDELTTTDTSATTSSSSSTTTLPDFGEGEDHCNGKIDFLFVIDRGWYMNKPTHWDRFHAAFPKFVDDVFTTFEGFDMHFMAIDGAGGWGFSYCEEPCKEVGTCDVIPDFPCERYINDEVMGCDSTTHGAGVVFPTGIDSANQDCGALDGRRFIVSDQPNALDAVKCIGQMGYVPESEFTAPTRHMLQALTPNTPAWDCNGDFLRDDAMLAVVYLGELQASPCVPSPPGEWANIVYEAKGGNKDRVMFIGLIDDRSSELPVICPGNGTENYGLCAAAFLHFYVNHRIEGSQCADDYAPYFEDGLEMLAQLCDTNIPT